VAERGVELCVIVIEVVDEFASVYVFCGLWVGVMLCRANVARNVPTA
jgi:hypothetical protein